MSDWIVLRHPFQKYAMNEKTLSVRSNATMRVMGGGGHSVKRKAKPLTKTPDGLYRLKHSVNGQYTKLHPTVISDCGIHGKRWPL